MTPDERALCYALRYRRFMGLKFRRQIPIGPFTADFYCAGHRLIIQADSSSQRLSASFACGTAMS